MMRIVSAVPTLILRVGIVLIFSFYCSLYAEDLESKAVRQGNANLKAYAAYKSGSYKRALAIWQQIAQEGNTTAMNNLSNMYEQGQGVAVDSQKSIAWLKKSAELNDSIAQLQLGKYYEEGRWVKKDLNKATQWFDKAAKQKEREAMFRLGVMLFTNYGKGNPNQQQIKQAYDLLQESKSLGYREAATYLPIVEAELKHD